MDTWAIFWICWFSYLAIKYTVNAFTYDKNKALRDIVRKESLKKIEEQVSDVCKKLDLENKLESILNDWKE